MKVRPLGNRVLVKQLSTEEVARVRYCFARNG